MRREARQFREEVKEAAQQGAAPAEEPQQVFPEPSAKIPRAAARKIIKHAANRHHTPKEKQAACQVQEPPKNHNTGNRTGKGQISLQKAQDHAVAQGREAAREKEFQKSAVQQVNVQHSAKAAPPVATPDLPEKQARQVVVSQKTSARKTSPKTSRQTVQPKYKAAAQLQSVKQADRSLKTAKAPIKTAANVTTRQSVYPTHRPLRKARKESIQALQKSAVKAAQTALRAIRVSAKSLATALGAGGITVVTIVVLLCMIGALLGSPFGIFFSGDADSELTVQSVMAQFNTEFSDKITEIENSVPHDDMQQTGTRAAQKEVLAVYAVKTSTDPEDALDVVTMDEQRAEILRRIFWAMNSIDYRTERYTEDETVTVTDEDGNETEETQTVERTRLVIIISGKTADEMAEEYGFTQEQLGLLDELLSDEYEELWYGLPFGGGSDDIVEVAISQIGNVGGQPYWSWYGFSSRVAWCACFVSWCANECGYIDSGVMPKFSYCPTGVDWFKGRGQWQGRSYVPEPGMIIFFDWDYDGESDHVGIVEYCDGATVYTVEGNANDACKRLRYTVGYSGIVGYGILE